MWRPCAAARSKPGRESPLRGSPWVGPCEDWRRPVARGCRSFPVCCEGPGARSAPGDLWALSFSWVLIERDRSSLPGVRGLAWGQVHGRCCRGQARLCGHLEQWGRRRGPCCLLLILLAVPSSLEAGNSRRRVGRVGPAHLTLLVPVLTPCSGPRAGWQRLLPRGP